MCHEALKTVASLQVVLAFCKDGPPISYTDPGTAAEVQIFSNEKEMLLAWLQLVREYDPDALITFQVSSP